MGGRKQKFAGTLRKVRGKRLVGITCRILCGFVSNEQARARLARPDLGALQVCDVSIDDSNKLSYRVARRIELLISNVAQW